MEIGGYFGLEEFSGKEYYSDLVALNTGRNALAYLIRAKGIKKIYIPRYLCDSVYKICEREGCNYDFYEIGEDFQLKFDSALCTGEWIYVVNYFGQITNELELKKKYNRIIFDNVQAFFQKPLHGIDTIYSCRKFFGVPDGAYLATDTHLDLSNDISLNRMYHILGRFEEGAAAYYKEFNKSDDSFYDLELRNMSRLTHNILRAIDYESVRKQREDNFIFLHNKLKDRNKLKLKVPSGPYMYPLYVDNGTQRKKLLVSKKIYIPTLWPNVSAIGGLAGDFSKNILPLPCDQRYTCDDMRIILDYLDEIW